MGWLSKAKAAVSSAASTVADTATSAATAVQNVIPEEVRNSRAGQVASYAAQTAADAAALTYGSAGVVGLSLIRAKGDPRKAAEESKRIVLDRVDTARKVMSGDYAGVAAKVSANTGGSAKELETINKAGSYYNTANSAYTAGQQIQSGDYQGAIDTGKKAGGTLGRVAGAAETAAGYYEAGSKFVEGFDPADLGAEGMNRASTYASGQLARAQNIGVSALGMVGKGPGFLKNTALAGLGSSGVVGMLGSAKSLLGMGPPGSSAMRGAKAAANAAERAGSNPAPQGVLVKKSFTKKIVDWFYT